MIVKKRADQVTYKKTSGCVNTLQMLCDPLFATQTQIIAFLLTDRLHQPPPAIKAKEAGDNEKAVYIIEGYGDC